MRQGVSQHALKFLLQMAGACTVNRCQIKHFHQHSLAYSVATNCLKTYLDQCKVTLIVFKFNHGAYEIYRVRLFFTLCIKAVKLGAGLNVLFLKILNKIQEGFKSSVFSFSAHTVFEKLENFEVKNLVDGMQIDFELYVKAFVGPDQAYFLGFRFDFQ